MPPSVADRLNDFVAMAEKVDRMTRGMTADAFEANDIVRGATERFLGIACEASLRLPMELKQKEADIDWRAMNDFANVLRHGYHAVDAMQVWDIVKTHLPKLKAFAARASLDRGSD